MNTRFIRFAAVATVAAGLALSAGAAYADTASTTTGSLKSQMMLDKQAAKDKLAADRAALLAARKAKAAALTQCQKDNQTVRTTYRQAVAANDKAYADAVKIARQTEMDAYKKVQADYTAAITAAGTDAVKIKAAKDAKKAANKALVDAYNAAKKAAAAARKTANTTALTTRNAGLKNCSAVTATTTGK